MSEILTDLSPAVLAGVIDDSHTDFSAMPAGRRAERLLGGRSWFVYSPAGGTASAPYFEAAQARHSLGWRYLELYTLSTLPLLGLPPADHPRQELACALVPRSVEDLPRQSFLGDQSV